eukprot:scaffold35840_cov51-Attheya_sp.AAC.1
MDKESCIRTIEDEEHKTFVMICTLCISGRWEVIGPKKWKTATINLDVIGTHTVRVWHHRLNDKIDTYKNKINTQIKVTLNDKMKLSANQILVLYASPAVGREAALEDRILCLTMVGDQSSVGAHSSIFSSLL